MKRIKVKCEGISWYDNENLPKEAVVTLNGQYDYQELGDETSKDYKRMTDEVYSTLENKYKGKIEYIESVYGLELKESKAVNKVKSKVFKSGLNEQMVKKINKETKPIVESIQKKSIKEDYVEKDGVKYEESTEKERETIKKEAELVKEKWNTIDLRNQVTPELKQKWYYKQVEESGNFKITIEQKEITIDYSGDIEHIKLVYTEPTVEDEERWIKSPYGNFHIKKGEMTNGGDVRTKFYTGNDERKIDLFNDSEYNTDFPIFQFYDGSKYSDSLDKLVDNVYCYIANYY